MRDEKSREQQSPGNDIGADDNKLFFRIRKERKRK